MKSLVETKTFWLAVIQAVVALIVIFTAAYPATEYAGVALIIKSVLDMFLRSQTSTPVVSVLPK